MKDTVYKGAEVVCPLCGGVAKVNRKALQHNVPDRYAIGCTAENCHCWGCEYLTPERALAGWAGDEKTTCETELIRQGPDVKEMNRIYAENSTIKGFLENIVVGSDNDHILKCVAERLGLLIELQLGCE